MSYITINKKVGQIDFINPTTILKSKNKHSISSKNKGEIVNVEEVHINIPHICIHNDNIKYVVDNKIHIYNYLNCTKLFTNNMNSKLCYSTIKDIIGNISTFAEIGVRYGGSYRYYIDKINKNTHIYLFEKEHLYCKLLNSIIDDRTTLIEGEAENTLQTIGNIIFDFVFFDASHKYNVDKNILISLIPHLNKSSIVLFDDTDIKDVSKLVEEFKSMNICKVITQ